MAPGETPCRLVGWVLDEATSQRRIRVDLTASGAVQVTTEVYGLQSCVVHLDAEGVGILQGLLAEALRRGQVDGRRDP